MAIHRQVKRIGGSLAVMIPRDLAQAASVEEGTAVRLTLVGRQIVVEPMDEFADEGAFRRSMAAVLRRRRHDYAALAAYDRGVL